MNASHESKNSLLMSQFMHKGAKNKNNCNCDFDMHTTVNCDISREFLDSCDAFMQHRGFLADMFLFSL